MAPTTRSRGKTPEFTASGGDDDQSPEQDESRQIVVKGRVDGRDNGGTRWDGVKDMER